MHVQHYAVKLGEMSFAWGEGNRKWRLSVGSGRDVGISAVSEQNMGSFGERRPSRGVQRGCAVFVHDVGISPEHQERANTLKVVVNDGSSQERRLWFDSAVEELFDHLLILLVNGADERFF